MIKSLAKSIREYKKASLLTPLFMVCEVAMECLLPLIMAGLIDSMESGNMAVILKYGLLLFAIACISLAAGVLSGVFAAKASAGFAKNLRHDLFYKVQDFAFSDIDSFSTASLVTRMTTDVSNVQNAYQMIIRIAVRTPLMLIFSVIMSLTVNAKMALIFLSIIPFLALALFLIQFSAKKIFRVIFKKYDKLNSSVQENISAIRVVKAFVREDFEKEKFYAASSEVCKDFTFAEKIIALNNPIMTFFIYVSMLLLCGIGSRMISVSTSLTTGQLSSLINYGVQIFSSMMMLSMFFVMTSMAIESAKRIAEVLEKDSSIKNPENASKEFIDASIDFENVSFKYTESPSFALTDINIHIKSGMTVGIIGGTGSSKSTLIQLIPRLYEVSSGNVKVGGKDVREYDLFALRDKVAIVLQKNILFSGTIRENLCWGNSEANAEEIKKVCQIAQADDFIQSFPDKYETHIEQGGTNVSGGQKQRLCIARALLKKPKILILDDSTSAVDTRTDALIRKALKEELRETTKIIIAQRVSSVQDADLIFVMDEGRIVESGNHKALLAKNGIYKEIYMTQNQEEEE